MITGLLIVVSLLNGGLATTGQPTTSASTGGVSTSAYTRAPPTSFVSTPGQPSATASTRGPPSTTTSTRGLSTSSPTGVSSGKPPTNASSESSNTQRGSTAPLHSVIVDITYKPEDVAYSPEANPVTVRLTVLGVILLLLALLVSIGVVTCRVMKYRRGKKAMSYFHKKKQDINHLLQTGNEEMKA